MTDSEMKRRSRSFDAWAAEYDRFRPSYPQALFDHIAQRLALPDHAQVADLGAGTGKAARQMARRGWHVAALEPGEGMLDVLRARAEAEGLLIEARVAPAEETGLADASVDLVTAAQAFHWFDKARAVPEMARIVRPSGGVAVFWNSRADGRSEFLAAYTELIARYVPDEHVDRRDRAGVIPTTRADLAQGGFFEVDDKFEIRHEVGMSQEHFAGYAFTASYTRLFVDEESQQRLRADLRALTSSHFGEGPVVVAYDLDVYVGRRIS
jgi:SAM-dependent methyltransferase